MQLLQVHPWYFLLYSFVIKIFTFQGGIDLHDEWGLT